MILIKTILVPKNKIMAKGIQNPSQIQVESILGFKDGLKSGNSIMWLMYYLIERDMPV